MVILSIVGCGGGKEPPKRADGRFNLSASQCLNTVRSAGITPIRWDAPRRQQCEVPTPLQLKATRSVVFEPTLRTACTMLAAWLTFEPIMQEIALDTLGSPVTVIYHFGSYACRPMRNGRAMSLHATARALDIAGFRTADGRTINLLADWDGGGDKEEFLRDFARAACRHFNVVLTPNHNAAHANHFHLDIGPWKVCKN